MDFLLVRLLKLIFLESPEVADLAEALESLLSDAWDTTEFLLVVDWLSVTEPKLSRLSLRVARLLSIPMLFLLSQLSKTEIISLPPMTQPSGEYFFRSSQHHSTVRFNAFDLHHRVH